MREGENVRPLELFFDLVFVLAFTQCTRLMAEESSWAGIGRGMLVVAALWWAWVGYSWLTSVIEPEEGAIRLLMFGAMAAMLIVSLCVPEAFGDRAFAFAIAYAVVLAINIGVYLVASRGAALLRRSVIGLGVIWGFAAGALIAAAFLDGVGQEMLWLFAITVDWVGPTVFGIAGWRMVPAHFAERHNLVIILALGESIVALGIGAEGDLTAGVIVAAVLGIGVAAALWWTYFDVVALVTARRLTIAAEGPQRNALARDSYSFLHLPMVAGIVLTALGLEETIAHVDDALDVEHAFALLGGVAIYLLAHVALRLRNAGTLNVERFLLALALFALIPIAVRVPAIATLAGVNVLLWSMIAYETIRIYDERRYRLRHGLDVEVPGPIGRERA
jgi:low temperature requirement protein LtrA